MSALEKKLHREDITWLSAVHFAEITANFRPCRTEEEIILNELVNCPNYLWHLIKSIR